MSRKLPIRLKQIWDVFWPSNIRKLWIKFINFLIEPFKLLSKNSLVSHLSNSTLLIFTTSLRMNALWNTVSVSITLWNTVSVSNTFSSKIFNSFIASLSLLSFSALLSASNSLEAVTSATFVSTAFWISASRSNLLYSSF